MFFLWTPTVRHARLGRRTLMRCATRGCNIFFKRATFILNFYWRRWSSNRARYVMPRPHPPCPAPARWPLTLSFVCIQEKLKKEKTDKKAKKVRQLSGKKMFFRLKIIVLIPDFRFRRSRKTMLICPKVIIVVIVIVVLTILDRCVSFYSLCSNR